MSGPVIEPMTDERLGKLLEYLRETPDGYANHCIWKAELASVLIELQGHRKPRRVIIDISGGLFETAYANAPIEILAIDELDHGNVRAIVPGFNGVHSIWAQLQEANVQPELVAEAFDGITWLPDGPVPEEQNQ